jgi:hypothetical protein
MAPRSASSLLSMELKFLRNFQEISYYGLTISPLSADILFKTVNNSFIGNGL